MALPELRIEVEVEMLLLSVTNQFNWIDPHALSFVGCRLIYFWDASSLRLPLPRSSSPSNVQISQLH